MSENKYIFDLRECTIINNCKFEEMIREKILRENDMQMLRNRIYKTLNYINEIDEYISENHIKKIIQILTGDSND